ncbi:MAG: Hsp20/alpha crystallin family protein [Candidatus Omnitrophica bacterium]|nr:Hsp20/alpha crystallin family protein [Candidatus Omnitrophota bacterium]
MRNKRILITVGIFIVVGIFLYNIPLFAQETKDIIELKKQILVLQKRVDELEAEKQKQYTDSTMHPRVKSGFVWDPFEEMDRMQAAMDLMFQDSFGRSGLARGAFVNNMSFDSAVNINKTLDGYTIEFDMTGMDQDKVDIQINQHSVTVKGEYSTQEKQEGLNQSLQIKSFGSFMKTIPLPQDADTAKMKTEKQDNKLIIYLPKKK